MYRGKRSFDILVTFCALPFVSLLLTPVVLFLFLLSGESPLFLQNRPGYKENLFNIYKLKTMYPQLSDSAFLNVFGKWLRKYSVDELPQLINVLHGDMSLVGPRPLLTEYLLLYNKFQQTRHDTKPGITGWAQIHGRNILNWDQRFSLDVWYAKNQSLYLDIKIILITIGRVFRTKDVRPEGIPDEEKFKGNQN